MSLSEDQIKDWIDANIDWNTLVEAYPERRVWDNYDDLINNYYRKHHGWITAQIEKKQQDD